MAEKTRKVLTITAFCVLPIAVATTALLLWRLEPSAQVKFERITPEMSRKDVQDFLNDPGSGYHPGDTAGKYRFDTKKQFRFLDDPNAKEKMWYWKYEDGLIIGGFDAKDVILWKSYFRRT